MTDFFISYTSADRQWAEWIAYVLEEKGFTTIIQAWDFIPGSNLVLEMQSATSRADRTVLVLSPDYLRSGMASSEWASAFNRDPEGLQRKLLPIMVRRCEPDGLLASIVQVRVDAMDEDTARGAILAGASRARAKPSGPPPFPGRAPSPAPRRFPGADHPPERPRSNLLPKIRTPLTDADRRNFSKAAFGIIRRVFGENLDQVVAENGRLESDLTDTTATDFRAELFLDGASKGTCRVWLGGMMGANNICFAEGRNFGDGCNEILAPSMDGDELALSASMAMGMSDFERTANMQALSPEQAADYLWSRFTRAFRF